MAGYRIYFEYGAGAGVTTSLCCAQAPSPNAVTKTATTMIVFKNFNLYRLLSQQVAPVCLGGEQRGSNAFLNFFESIANWVAGLILRSQSFPRLWSQSLCVERKHQNSKQWPKRPRSRSPLKVSIYLASFRSKLHCPFRITRKQRFSCLFWMYHRAHSPEVASTILLSC